MPMKKFLTAKWKDLILVNYEVDPALLAERVPLGTEIDLFEGRCFVSLVAFMFRETKVKGFYVPFHINFEEINLRFYVKREAEKELRRGVVFIKEIVPRTAIAAVARYLFGEPYEAAEMSHQTGPEQVSYRVSKDGRKSLISVKRGRNLGLPADESFEAFIIEHYWGYTKRGDRRTDEYKVEHPKWELYSTHDPIIDLDFGQWYGKKFDFLSSVPPHSALLADGSEVSVFRGQSIR